MRFFLFVVFFSLSLSSVSQSLTDSVHWVSLEEAGDLFAEKQKPIMIYLHKLECDSCREQDKTTFSNPEVANYINILFYPVKINAETKDSLKFFDGKYYHNSETTGKTHDLVEMIAGADTLPTLVMFSKRAAGRAFKGFKDRDEIFRILIYYAEDIDVSTPFEDWYKYHTKGYPAGQSQIITRLKIKWEPLNIAQELNKAEPKKMLLNFYNYNKISCTLMRTQTFNNDKIASYLNDKFYSVNIDIFSQDTLEIKGIKYINENKSYKFHQLPIAALEGKMNFPAFIIMDEEGNILSKFQEYMTAEKFEKIMYYYGEDKYKTEKFDSFLKSFESKLNID